MRFHQEFSHFIPVALAAHVNQRLKSFVSKIDHRFVPSQRVAVINAMRALVVMSLIWWYVGGLLEQRLLYEVRENTAAKVESLGTSLTLSVNQRLFLVAGLHSYVSTKINYDGQLDPEELDTFVKNIHTQIPGVRNIALAPQGVMQYIYPFEENKSVLGYEPSKDERQSVREDVRRAIASEGVILSLPIELIQGGQGIVARQAVYIDGRYWGLVNIVIDVPHLLEVAGISPLPYNLNLAIKDQAGEVFFGEQEVFSSDPILYSVILPEGKWELAGTPEGGWQVAYQVSLAVYRLLGLVVVLTISLLVYQFMDRRERLEFLVEQRTAELTQSNQTLLNVLEGIDADVYVSGFETFEILFANKHIKDSFQDGLVGKICYEVFRHETGICADCKKKFLFDATNQPTGVYLWESHNPITGHWYKNADRVIRWNNGRYVHLQIATDISEQKQAETTLKESAARYQAVVESQKEFIVRWKPDGRRTFVNEAYLRYFNLTMEDALNATFLPLVTEDDRRFVEEKVSRLVTNQVACETDLHRVIKPDGSVGWQEWTDQAIYNDRGEIVEFQSVGRDVTERMQAEEALRTKTEELEALFSISSHLRTAQSADAMLPLVLEEMRRVLRSDANAVILLESNQEYFVCALSDGPLAANTGGKSPVDKSISGLVLRTGSPYLTEDLWSDPQKSSTVLGYEDLGPAVVVPVVSESEFLGVLLCARQKNSAAQQFTSSEVRLLTAIGEMVGNALRRARLYDQALKRMQHLQTLHSIDTAISANLDLGVILDVLLTQGMAQLDVDAASVLLLNPHTHMLEFAAGKGFRTRKIQVSRLRLGEGLPGQVALERKAIHVPDLEAAKVMRGFFLEEGFVSYQGTPLIAKGQLQGVLEVFNRGTMAIDEERTEFLETLAIQAAIAIDNSQLFSDLQRTNFELEMAYDATIEGWSRALELRDFETEGHTLRVTDMTVQLALELGVPNQELIHIRRGALLHDIGKMGVPDRILLKPGKLDPEEWEVMKRHTVYAREMLWPIEFLRPAIDIPYCHHERWDGTGYPRQLKAEQIPLSARLFAVADVWDALTSNRSYRKAWTRLKALDYIQSNVGKHFDPRVVEIFLILQNKQGQAFAFE